MELVQLLKDLLGRVLLGVVLMSVTLIQLVLVRKMVKHAAQQVIVVLTILQGQLVTILQLVYLVAQ
jgi:hypothetical protein